MKGLTNKWMALYCLGMVFAVWAFVAVMQSVFVPFLEMDDDWCRETIELSDGAEECFLFKNRLEEAKHFHNKRMRTRNGIVLGITFALLGFCNFLVWHLVPSWKGNPPKEGDWLYGIWEESKTTAIMNALVAAFFMMAASFYVLDLILPPAIEWFPPIFREVHYATTREALWMLTYY